MLARRSLRALAVADVLVSSLAAGHAAPAPSAQIVFASDRDGELRLYAARLDGSGVTRLTDAGDDHRNPEVAPDGSRIIFESAGGADVDLLSLDPATGEIAQLTRGGRNTEAAWSPDGARIVFRSNRGGDEAIFVMSRSGADVRRLSPPGAGDRSPAWSPDGARIAFGSLVDGREHIFVMDADGSNRTRLTDAAGDHAMPAWSPDGSRIVFSSTTTGRHDTIMVMQADGTRMQAVGSDPGLRTRYMDRNTASWGPVFSSDGRRILFTSLRDGNAEIYVMDADGSNVRRVTRDRGQDLCPAWVPATLSLVR